MLVNETFQYRGITFSIIDVAKRTVRVGTGIDIGDVSNAVPSDYGPNLQIPNFVTYKDTVFSVTEVGIKAFFFCMNLRTIHIGFCIEIVRNRGFSQCRNVTTLTFDQNSRLRIIEESGFYDFYSLTSIIFTGDSLESIGLCAFCFAFVLKSITIPPSVTNISYSAFKGLDSFEKFQYCGSTAITSDVFYRDNYNGHSTPSSIAVSVTSSYPISKFASDTVQVDDTLNCVFPKAATYNLICNSNNRMYILPDFSSFLAFIFM